MRSDPEAHLVSSRCGACTRITAAQAATLSALPDPVEPIMPYVACELAVGHAGEHAALAVASDGGDRWWWVCWDWHRHDVVHIDPCDAEEPAVPDSEFCLFPAGHCGPHSFEL